MLYKNLLRTAHLYDQHSWNRSLLAAEPAIRHLLPSLAFYLSDRSCVDEVRRAFRRPMDEKETGHTRVTLGFAALRALNHSSYVRKVEQRQAASAEATHERDDEEDEDDEDDEQEEDEEAVEAEIAEEAEALLAAQELDTQEASMLRSALRGLSALAPHHFIHAQPKQTATVLPSATAFPLLTANALRQRTEDEEDAVRERPITHEQSLRHKQRQARRAEEDEADEDEDDEEDDDGDEQQRRFDWETTVVEASKENLHDPATLLAHYPFTPEQLQLVEERHDQLSMGLARLQDEDESERAAVSEEDDRRKVMEAMRFFVGEDSIAAGSVPWHWRLSVEDCHSAMHQLLDWEADDVWAAASEGVDEEGEEEDGEETSDQMQATTSLEAARHESDAAEDRDDNAADEEEEADLDFRLEENQKLRTYLYARMKEHGYELKPSLVKRLLKEAKRNGTALNALTLLRDTAIGRRLRDADRKADGNPTADTIQSMLSALMRGEQPPLTAQSPQPSRKRSGELVEQRRIQAESPLVELAIEATADADFTEAIHSTYPSGMAHALRQPPTSNAAFIAPLTTDHAARHVSTNSTAALLAPSTAIPPTPYAPLPHLSLELYAVMRLHNLPFTRASTVNALLAVCNEMQLSYLAADVAHKALQDLAPAPSTSSSRSSASSFRAVARSRVAVSILDSLVTIACNCCHLHLALATLDRWDGAVNARPIDTPTWATLLNYALHGPQHTLPPAVITSWARGRGIELAVAGWDGNEADNGSGRQLLALALIEAAGARGVAGDDLIREAQRAVSKELVRSMRDEMREIGRWINQQMKGEWREEADDDDDDDDGGEDDGHKRW